MKKGQKPRMRGSSLDNLCVAGFLRKAQGMKTRCSEQLTLVCQALSEDKRPSFEMLTRVISRGLEVEQEAGFSNKSQNGVQHNEFLVRHAVLTLNHFTAGVPQFCLSSQCLIQFRQARLTDHFLAIE